MWLTAGATWVLEKSDDKAYCNWKMAFAGVSCGPASNCSKSSTVFHSTGAVLVSSPWELIKYL